MARPQGVPPSSAAPHRTKKHKAQAKSSITHGRSELKKSSKAKAAPKLVIRAKTAHAESVKSKKNAHLSNLRNQHFNQPAKGSHIPVASMARFLTQSMVRRKSPTCFEPLERFYYALLEDLSWKIVVGTEASKRVTITDSDVHLALSCYGLTQMGSTGKPPKKRKSNKKTNASENQQDVAQFVEVEAEEVDDMDEVDDDDDDEEE